MSLLEIQRRLSELHSLSLFLIVSYAFPKLMVIWSLMGNDIPMRTQQIHSVNKILQW